MKPKYPNLEDSQIWKNMFQIALLVRDEYDSMNEDEKYPYEYDLSNEATACLKYAAEAAGSIDPRDQTWQLGLARARLFGVKSTLKLIYGYKLLEVNPELMVLIDKTIKLIDSETSQLPIDIKRWQKAFDIPAGKNHE